MSCEVVADKDPLVDGEQQFVGGSLGEQPRQPSAAPPENVHAEPRWSIIQVKFIPKNPVSAESGRKIVATIVSRSCTSLE